MMPDFQDQITATGLLQQAYRRVGVHFDDSHRVRVSAAIGEHIHGGDAKSKRACGPPRQRERGIGSRRFKRHRSTGAQIHPSGNFPTLAFGQHGVERRTGIYGNR